MYILPLLKQVCMCQTALCVCVWIREVFARVQCCCFSSPGVFNREALHLQQLSQRVVLTVDYVLSLFVIQLLSHDVLAQVVHDLNTHIHHDSQDLHG